MPGEHTESSGWSEYSRRVDRLAGQLVRLTDLQLSEVERLVNKLEMNANSTVRQVLDGGVWSQFAIGRTRLCID